MNRPREVKFQFRALNFITENVVNKYPICLNSFFTLSETSDWFDLRIDFIIVFEGREVEVSMDNVNKNLLKK